MLSQFSFKNYKSYKDETVFDLQAVSGQGFQDSLLSDGYKYNYLPVSVIYGPNGGGKSNALRALSTLISTIVNPILAIRGTLNLKITPPTPFLFDNSSKDHPVEFEIFFQPNNDYEYKYILHLKQTKIIKEQLYRRKLANYGKSATLFERDENGITLGSSINNKSINKNVNENMPFFSYLAATYNIESINDAANWLILCTIINYALPLSDRHTIWNNDEEFKKNFVTLLNDTGINISDIIVEDNESTGLKVFLEHTIDNEKYLLSLGQESDGTKKLFSILPFVINALNEGRLLIVDELDAKLHPKLLKYIIMLFKDPKINRKKAQLLFTSHDVSTMKSSVFRTDEIWFAYKKENESSDLYSLYELRDESGNHIGQHTAFDKQYLEGRYGADPYLQHMTDWG